MIGLIDSTVSSEKRTDMNSRSVIDFTPNQGFERKKDRYEELSHGEFDGGRRKRVSIKIIGG